MQQRILISSIALELEGIVTFTRHIYAVANLRSGKIIALKKLHCSETEETTFINSFKNEVHVISKIVHRNILKLYGFCLHKICMFFIYECTRRRSLFFDLHNHNEVVELNWKKRVSIVKSMLYLTYIITAYLQLFTTIFQAIALYLTQNWRQLLRILACLDFYTLILLIELYL